MRIQEEGLEQDDFDPTESLHNFMGIRDRRKLCEPWSSDLQTRCLLFYSDQGDHVLTLVS